MKKDKTGKKKRKKVIYLSWNKSYCAFNIWKTRGDAERGMRGQVNEYDVPGSEKGLMNYDEICRLKEYLGFVPSKTKVVKVTLTW